MITPVRANFLPHARLVPMRSVLQEYLVKVGSAIVPYRNHHSIKEVSGSSFAAPITRGLLARLISLMPGLRPLEAKVILHRLAAPWRSDVIGPNVRIETAHPTDSLDRDPKISCKLNLLRRLISVGLVKIYFFAEQMKNGSQKKETKG
jgi:hypothetical protein